VNVTEAKTDKEPTLVERWLQDQQQWQRTILSYLDSMVKDEDFLVHLGNAMRGSLLAGKPYPTAGAVPSADQEATADDRLDRVLFALNQLQGQLQDLALTLDEVRRSVSGEGTKKVQARREPRSRGRPSRPKPAVLKARKRGGAG
jgi:hypothetical protein